GLGALSNLATVRYDVVQRALPMAASNDSTSATPPFTSDPDVMGGRLVFRGTRIPVELLFEHLAEGMSLGDILNAYPTLNRADAVAAIELAGESVKAGLMNDLTVAQTRDARRQTITRSSERLGRVFARLKRATSETR